MVVVPATNADIVILGATPAGIAAAIAAARRGKTSIVVERTPFVGGLPANGLGATDIKTRGATGGLFYEFTTRIRKHYEDRYGKDSQQVKDSSDGYHFEPHVAEEIFNDWLNSHSDKITVRRRRQFDFEPEHVEKKDGRIQSIRVQHRLTAQVEVFRGKFFLDCTYEGDLISAAGVPILTGRESIDEYDETAAGKIYKYMYGPEGQGSTHRADNAIQAYNYRLCMTKDPRLRTKIEKPPNYRREEFTSLVEDVRSGRHTGVQMRGVTESQLRENMKKSDRHPPEVAAKVGLNGISRLVNSIRLPNNKADGNNQHYAFISTDLPEENWAYPTSGWHIRDAFAQRLREYTEGLFYFAQNDDALPGWFRDACKEYGWAKDEYLENGHFPRQVYVREGRRMKGKYIFKASDAQRPPSSQSLDISGSTSLKGTSMANPRGVSTTVTASHYNLDSHGVRKREPGRCHLDGFFSYPVPPYSVPYGVIVPDAPLVNLLSPVPVSGTHVGFSTLRMEPCWMALGQAAGIAASLCIESDTSAEDVDMDKLQNILLDQDAVLIYDKSLWADGVTPEDRRKMQRKWLDEIKAQYAESGVPPSA